MRPKSNHGRPFRLVSTNARTAESRHRARRRTAAARQALRFESLEDRRMLSAGGVGGGSPTLTVTGFDVNASGFIAQFNQTIDPAVLNLYDAETGGLGPADGSLVGDSLGAVNGSILVDGNRVTFVATGGILAPDIYTVELRSGEDAFKSLNGGELLDGEWPGTDPGFPSGDGTPGGDFVFTFTVESPAEAAPIVVGLPDFARGPGQMVDVPAFDGTEMLIGLPIQLSDAVGIEALEMTIVYDPSKLEILGAHLGADAPASSLVIVNTDTPGQLTLGFISPLPLWSGLADIITLDAIVPDSAEYGTAQLIDITNVEINDGALAAVGDDAVHVVAFPGDATGDGEYGALDSQRITRVFLGLDSGFAAFPTIDPVVIADVTGNGSLSVFDAEEVLAEAIGIDSPYIPPIPMPINDQPVAHGQTVTTDEDTAAAIQLTGDDGDPEVDQVLTFAITRNPDHGTLTDFDPATGAVTYTPDADYNGPDSFEFTVTDDDAAGEPANLESAPTTVEIGITPINDEPIAHDLSPTVLQDVASTIFLDGEDGDPLQGEDQVLTYFIDTDPLHGTAVLIDEQTGEVLYTPEAGYSGADSFIYGVLDDNTAGEPPGLASPLATVDITVEEVDDLPDAVDDEVPVDEGGTAIGDVLANDTGLSDVPIVVTLDTGPMYASSFVLNGDGTFSYEHNDSENFEDSFVYRVEDSNGDFDTATVFITVSPVNDNSPNTVGETIEVDEGGTATAVAAAGTVDFDIETTASVGSTGTVDFNIITTAAVQASGIFTVGTAGSDTITVTAVAGGAADGVAGNGIDVTIVDDGTVANGVNTVTFAAGVITASADVTGGVGSDVVAAAIQAFNGGADFTSSSDNTNNLIAGDITNNVDVTSGGSDAINTTETIDITGTLAAGASGDVDISFAVAALGASNPTTNLLGSSGGPYTVQINSDTVGGVSIGDIRAAVQSITEVATAAFNGTPGTSVFNGVGTDTAPGTTSLAGGVDQVVTTETIDITSVAGATGNVSISFAEADLSGAGTSVGGSATTGYILTIDNTVGVSINDIRLAIAGITEIDTAVFNGTPGTSTYNAAADTPPATVTQTGGTNNLLANDTDDDLPNDSLTLNTTAVVGPSHGTLTLNADGTFLYEHDGSESVTDQFEYEVIDEAGNTSTATVDITITPINDAPVNIVPAGPISVLLGNVITFDLPLAVADDDVGDGDIRVTITMEHLSVGLNEIVGSIDFVNSVLAGLVFTPEPGYMGDGWIEITTNDMGNTGEGGPMTDIDRIDVSIGAPTRFDFGTSGSPVMSEYTQVTSGTVYDVARGFGWMEGTIRDVDRASGSDLDRDLNFTNDGTFIVDVAPGSYRVVLRLGDLGEFAHESMGIVLEGIQVDELSTAAGEVVSVEYDAIVVSDGQLTLRLVNRGGPDANVVIEALEITNMEPMPESAGGASVSDSTAASPIIAATVWLPTDVSGAPGDTVQIPILIDQADGVNAAGIVGFHYDPTILTLAEIDGVLAGSVWPAANTSVGFNVDETAGTITAFVLNAVNGAAGDGTLIEFRFIIAADADAGSSSIISLETIELDEVNFAPIENGMVTVTAPATADFNEDGVVDGDDFLLWQIGFGLQSGAGLIDGDSDGDGDVDAVDFQNWNSANGAAAAASADSQSAAEAVAEPATFSVVELAGDSVVALTVEPVVDSSVGSLGLVVDKERMPVMGLSVFDAPKLAFSRIAFDRVFAEWSESTLLPAYHRTDFRDPVELAPSDAVRFVRETSQLRNEFHTSQETTANWRIREHSSMLAHRAQAAAFEELGKNGFF